MRLPERQTPRGGGVRGVCRARGTGDGGGARAASVEVWRDGVCARAVGAALGDGRRVGLLLLVAVVAPRGGGRREVGVGGAGVGREVGGRARAAVFVAGDGGAAGGVGVVGV